jgi:hypothetical protein
VETAIQTQLVAAISASRTRAEDAPGFRKDAAGEGLRKLKADTGRAVGLAKRVRQELQALLRQPDEHRNEAALTFGLVFLGFVAENLEDLGVRLSGLEKKASGLSVDLSAEMRELAQLADDFRDLEETFALGLSSTFRDEVKRAREQAVRS